MLTYLIQTTERLALLALCLSVVYGYRDREWKKDNLKRGYTVAVSFLVGLGLAITMTYFKTNTALVDTSLWNLRNHVATIILFVLFLILSLLEARKILKINIGTKLSLGLMLVLFMLYYLPYVLEMPYIIMRTEESILSTNFIVRLSGILIAIVISILIGTTVYRGMIRLKKGTFYVVVYLLLTIHIIKYVGLIIGTLLTRRMIKSNHTLFTISKFTSNYMEWFIFVSLLICVIFQISLIIRSYTQKELYKNPAQRRKIISKWRKSRKQAIITILCSIGVLLILTVIKEYDGREVELSPIEETKQDEKNMYVSFDQVEDGKLHRYGYTAEDGTVIRYIIIKKPNSSSYGVGLDACEICGETGYYQRGDMVVCNLCDVVMNINTIGFKGGCNPIVIDYSVENGNIIVPIEGLLEHLDEFK